jgi:PAS domain S-box-containing protein
VETLRATAGLIGVAIAHDQTVSALRDSERRFRGILESALDGIVTTDDRGVILEFNPAAEAMFGVARRRAIGAKIRDVIIPERLRAAHDAGMARYLSTGDSHILNQRIEVMALRGEDEFPAELTVTSTQVAGRTLFTAHVRDLTQQKEAAQEIARHRDRLYQSEKMSALGSLLAGWHMSSITRYRSSSVRHCCSRRMVAVNKLVAPPGYERRLSVAAASLRAFLRWHASAIRRKSQLT